MKWIDESEKEIEFIKRGVIAFRQLEIQEQENSPKE